MSRPCGTVGVTKYLSPKISVFLVVSGRQICNILLVRQFNIFSLFHLSQTTLWLYSLMHIPGDSCLGWFCDVLIYGHLSRSVMCHSHHMTKQAPSSFDGRIARAHWAALASFIESIAGNILRVSDVIDLSQLTYVECIKPSPFCWYQPRVHML